METIKLEGIRWHSHALYFEKASILGKIISPLPDDPMNLDPQTKRALTICNLFVNHHMSIPNIQHLLDEDAGKIVYVLIEHSILKDRRQMNLRAPAGVNRRIARKVEDKENTLESKGA